MSPMELAQFVAESLDGDYHEDRKCWISAHVDSDLTSVWIELTSDAGAPAGEYRVTLEQQSGDDQ